MCNGLVYPITIGETDTFLEDIEKLVSDKELNELIDYLAFNPAAGEEIDHTGGVRELRYVPDVYDEDRVICVYYFFKDLGMPLYALTACKEGAEARLDGEAKRFMRALTREIKDAYARDSQRIRRPTG
jgi:hypothetical protein